MAYQMLGLSAVLDISAEVVVRDSWFVILTPQRWRTAQFFNFRLVGKGWYMI